MENYDLSKEQTVLGSLLYDPDQTKRVIPKLTKIFGSRGKKVFYYEKNRAIYEAISELYSRRDPVELPAIYSLLKNRKKDIPKSYLSDLVGHDLTRVTPEYYAEELNDLAIRRELEKLGLGIVAKIKSDTTTNSLIEGIQEKVGSLRKESTPQKKSMTALESLNTPVIGNPSPIAGGLLVPGRYTILAATDGEGKTTFCLQLALCAVTGTSFLGRFPIKKPAKVLYFCGENSRGDINDKLRKQILQLESLLSREIKEDLRNFRLVEPLDIDFLLDRKQDIPLLNNWLETYRPDIVIFDPLNNFVGDDESLNNDPIARKTAKALNKLAGDFNCFPILTTHFKKEGEVKPSSIFEMFHGSKYWTNPAASQIAITRASQQKYPAAKKVYFKFKTVTETSPMLMLRDKDSLWYEEISPNEISKAKLMPKDVVEILKRKCNGKAVPSIFVEIVAKELDCSERQIWELVKVAKDKGLIVKKSGLMQIVDFRKRKEQEFISS
ncbi:MAG: AAA family ATPase [bacterium]